jgi:signal transduction histidine kinase
VARKRTAKAASGYTILVVDDQEAALTSTKLVLESEGHRVLLADSGRAALELFGEHEIHLLLVDYFMPQMTGEQLVAAIRKRDGDVQIVLQTGYSGEKPPREMLATLAIQGYHDKSEGPEKLLLWVGVALKAYEQLHRVREAERLKSQIIANISHEFRTPLNVILGYSEVLREEGWVTVEGMEHLAAVHRNAEMLLHLVVGFLRLADTDAGSEASGTTAVTAEALRDEMTRWAEYFIATKPVAFVIDLPADLPAVLVDEAKLRVITMNLLSNAAKFTQAGGITVTANSDGDRVEVAVRDTGVGIARDQFEKIFEPFHQTSLDEGGYSEGTGIGLTIARKLARQMGGDITVDSEPGAGATFFLRLPPAAATGTRATESPVRAAVGA